MSEDFESDSSGGAWFSDDSIVEQTEALIANGYKRTRGISILVRVPDGVRGVEVLLERDELEAALKSVDQSLLVDSHVIR